MAAKKTNGKAKAKRTAPKAKPKTKVKTSPKAKAKPTGKVSKQASRPKTKPKAKRTTKRAQRAAPPPPPTESISAGEAPTTEVAALDAKKGRLARLAGGVGNLFARMTGKKAEGDQAATSDETPSPDQTIELASGDILASTDAPPPAPRSKS